MKAIVLAAGRGRRFGVKTKTLPKCLVPLDKKKTTLLRRYLDIFRETRIKDVVIVIGHLKEKIICECKLYGKNLRIRFVTNPEYARGSVVSLYRAAAHLSNDALIMDADVYFESNALKKLLRSGKRSAFLIDSRSKSAGEEMMLMANHSKPIAISKKVDPSLKILGEATGILKLAAPESRKLKSILKDFYRRGIRDVEYEETYSKLMEKNRVGFVPIEGFWSEMDFTGDLRKISEHLRFLQAHKNPKQQARRHSK